MQSTIQEAMTALREQMLWHSVTLLRVQQGSMAAMSLSVEKQEVAPTVALKPIREARTQCMQTIRCFNNRQQRRAEWVCHPLTEPAEWEERDNLSRDSSLKTKATKR